MVRRQPAGEPPEEKTGTWPWIIRCTRTNHLRLWLHQIARREFLHLKRRQRPATSLEEVAELPEPSHSEWTEGAELRLLLEALPVEQREVMLLHYLAGYSSGEIAQIIQTPASTVRYRLGAARSRLAQALQTGDLAYLNEPAVPMRQWAWLPLDQMHDLELRLAMTSAPRQGPDHQEDTMERREFLRQAAASAAGLMLPETEKEVVDGRLTQKVTCAFKGMALSDLCERLRSETKVHLVAGRSVADEKVTLFCEKLSLREVMRQLSRPFGYTWVRSTRNGLYRYELMQDLRSQLLEEELRNRDRNAALVALEEEIERYRPYLDLTPDEALARARTAPTSEKPLLEKLAGFGWGPIQMYFRLSRQQQEALRAGQELKFSQEPRPDEQPLPADIARGIFQSFRDWRVVRHGDRIAFGPEELAGSGVLPSASSDVRARLTVFIQQSEPGQFTLSGLSAVFHPGGFNSQVGDPPYAVGRSPGALKPDNRAANGNLANHHALRSSITVLPEPSCGVVGAAGSTEAPQPRVTTADVLEALHRATGMPVVGDFYTRLYKREVASVKNRPLFDGLNDLGDAMRLRWRNEDDWLQFRSASYYDDRLKEVPNRLLQRWSLARQRQGMLMLDDLVEIAQLSDAQLDGADMAEGARVCRGLAEWELGRDCRKDLRYLAGFTPEQRQAAMSAAGLPFTRMSLAQQQLFLIRALHPDADPIQDLTELAGAALRVEYTQPGWFQWGDPALYHSWTRWVLPIEPGREGRRVIRPPVRVRTREAVLRELLRLDPQLVQAAIHSTLPNAGSRAATTSLLPLEAQVFPTDLRLTFIYIPSRSNGREIRISSGNLTNYQPSW